jgi:hypothetical protein
MVSALAGDAPSFFFVLAAAGSVLSSACTADVFFGWAFPCKVSPSSAFHALDGFEFLFCWPDSGAADV